LYYLWKEIFHLTGLLRETDQLQDAQQQKEFTKITD